MVGPIINGINTNFLPSGFVQNGNIVGDPLKAAQVASGIQAKLEKMPPAEQALFLAAIHSSPDLTSDMVSHMDIGQISDAINRLSTAAEHISNAISWLFQGGSNAAMSLGRILIQQATSERQSALEDRMAAREEAKNELLGQAAQQKASAATMIAGAIAGLVVSVVTAALSAISIGSEAKSIGKMAKQLEGMKKVADEMKTINKQLNKLSKLEKLDKLDDAGKIKMGDKETKLENLKLTKEDMGGQFSILDKKAQLAGTITGAISGLGGGIGGFVNSFAQGKAKEQEAEGSTMAADAQLAQAKEDHAKTVQQAFEDTIKQLIQFLKDMQDSKANQMAAFTKV